MNNLNLEIIEYIEGTDLDERMKAFFKQAIIFEMRNPDAYRFTADYEKMIEDSLE